MKGSLFSLGFFVLFGFCCLFVCLFCFDETGSHCVAQAGFEPVATLQPQPPKG